MSDPLSDNEQAAMEKALAMSQHDTCRPCAEGMFKAGLAFAALRDPSEEERLRAALRDEIEAFAGMREYAHAVGSRALARRDALARLWAECLEKDERARAALAARQGEGER